MARSNIKTHISIHISMEIIQGIQIHIDLHFHLYSPPQKLSKTENRGMNLTLGCWFGFFAMKMEGKMKCFWPWLPLVKILSLRWFEDARSRFLYRLGEDFDNKRI